MSLSMAFIFFCGGTVDLSVFRMIQCRIKVYEKTTWVVQVHEENEVQRSRTQATSDRIPGYKWLIGLNWAFKESLGSWF